ncbi:hypothetical protein ACMV_19940 [Acidiphilium multivorum AIU301]|uniref:Uncharacterized protein n=1 Tax=Acidiphilium multivorum (strain DSM 11245 / JCM 8867 / NBRC 100883 / AIU 301) TaxID=926570 RepID=F0IZY1_ACIMA|nr:MULTISPECIES: phosphosulfolactate synthase [Acidiphilium]MBU6357840.1 phosphosulfolactate synthase [Rhodospirillales bacterium]EGO96917.1 phosphosulfolactate synthase [Acidiphilium sp. PM]MDE2327614.1 phosphosulfolactate synthase [Rhodospirillales bacterium]BAJ81341.1 hypothetical protein ACMV_19940 [Acidiphilium multivorum AIU301]GAN75024.1 hypothetical protein Apmu_0258_08 [Acidiphilium multivorum AIU301]
MELALPRHNPKPRARGITAMIDFGPDTFGWTGPAAIHDLIACAGAYIDYAKIYALNSLLMPETTVKMIVATYADAGIMTYSGGILFEYAWQRGALDEMLSLLERIGIPMLEISENYVTLDDDERLRLIERFQSRGFEVIYEFGRKNPEAAFTVQELGRLVADVTDAGVAHVIVEQSEIDMLDADAMRTLVRQDWFASLLIETDPYRFPQQHAEMLNLYGPEINLANVTPGQVLRLEGLRQGIGRAVNYRLMA